MTKQKHTPGPWELSLADADAVDSTWWEVEGPDGEHIASNTFGGNDKITEFANARLIAAAPELFEAVMECSDKFCLQCCGGAYETQKCEGFCYKLRKLIAKVKGETI